MSLEQALADNTAAINKLIAALESKPEAETRVETPKAEPKVEKAKAEEPKVEKAKTAEPAALVYATDLRAPFLALVASNEKAALDMLAKLGVKSLKEIEPHPEKYAEVKALLDTAAKEA